MYFPKMWDSILKLWWDNKWKKSKVLYNTKGERYEDVRTSLYENPTGKIELTNLAESLKSNKGEDATMRNIMDWVNNFIIYVSDRKQFGKEEFWQGAYETYKGRKGDCDDVAILAKVLSLFAGVPDYRVKICCLDTYYSNGNPAGGHANILYLTRENNEWIFLEGTFRGNWSNKYGRIWFTFNREHSWAQHSIKFESYSLKKLKKIAEEIQ